MTTSYASGEATVRARGGAAHGVGGILRLLSGGAAEAILLALADGPLQTKVLTHRVRGYTARTVYRYLPKLARLGLVERDDDPQGPAKVLHTLTPRAGRDMCALVERFASASATRLPHGQVELSTWGSLSLLADLWDAGVVAALSHGPRSPTELVQRQQGLSYHQVNRKIRQFKEAGFVEDSCPPGSRQRAYALTDKARRTMALVAAVGRWRREHLAGVSDEGLGPEEMATVIRAAMPLATRERDDLSEMEQRVDGGHVAVEWSLASAPLAIDGDVGAWLAALVDGRFELAVEGERALGEALLTSLYERLWTPSPF